MDFQQFVEGFAPMTCVVSVEKLKDGGRGKIRIVTGNQAYIDSIERPVGNYQMLTNKFIPNSEYTAYLTRDLNFEEYCYRSAVQKKCLHSYVHPDRIDAWFNMTFLPVAYEEENLCYCTYSMEINFEPSSERLSTISGDMASQVLETCVKLRGTKDFSATIKEVIKDIRDLCGAEHCCIFLMDSYERTCSVLCEAFSDDTKLLPMETYLDDSFYEIAESWEGTIAGSNCLIAKDSYDMEVVRERNPVWYQSLTAAGGKTIVLFPLKSGDELLGYIWAINFDAENALKIKETLELTTFILGSEIGNYLLLNRLQFLSSRDMLTGVLNRNEMNNYVTRIYEKNEPCSGSIGVIFADMNGLKTVNDEYGHSAGDALLRDAARVLGEEFSEEEIYRAGGDEFVMILTGVTEEALEEKIRHVRKAADEYPNLSFALGSCLIRDTKEIHEALKIADERMYADKREYYLRHPEKKRTRSYE